MTIKKTPYDTTACAGYITNKIVDALQAAMIKRSVHPMGDRPVILVTKNGINELTIPAFAHPIAFEHEGTTYVAADVRNFGRYDPLQMEFIVQDKFSYDGVRARALLTERWVNGFPEELRAISGVGLGAFASVVSESVGKRFALDVRDQYILMILASIMFVNLFWEKVALSDTDKHLVTTFISRSTGIKAQDVLNQLEAFPTLSTVPELCQACQEASTSTRMRDLNPTTLFGVVGGYWYGANAKELMAVSLEHPPTWLGLVHQAFGDYSFRNTQLAKVLERTPFKKNRDTFLRQIVNYAEQV